MSSSDADTGCAVRRIATARERSRTRQNLVMPNFSRLMPSFTESTSPSFGHDLSVVMRTFEFCATALQGSTRHGKHGKNSRGP